MKEMRSRDATGISTISDFDWMLPNSVSQCCDSVLVFATVNRSLWPYDTTNISLTKVYNRYDWCVLAGSEGNRVKLVRAVFNRVMEV